MGINLDGQWENFILFGLLHYVDPRKFELFWGPVIEEEKSSTSTSSGHVVGFRQRQPKSICSCCSSKPCREVLQNRVPFRVLFIRVPFYTGDLKRGP